MQLNKRWVYVVFLFVLFPVTAYSRTGLYELPAGETAVGLSLGRGQNSSAIGGNLGYGISNRTKIAFTGGVSFIDKDLYDGSVHQPSNFSGGIALIYIRPLGQTGLDYFFSGNTYTGFSRLLDASTNETIASAHSVGLTGGGGLIKRLETNFGWALKPFCGIFCSGSWASVSNQAREKTKRDFTFFGFTGNVGLEIEISSMISVVGVLGISLEDFNRGFSIGLNLH